MKKLMTAMLCLMPIMAFGVDVCVKNNTMIMILKNDVPAGTPTGDNANKIWKVEFNYKTITGDAACNEISGTVKTPVTNLYTDAEDSGQYCWCRMWPILSYGYETGPSSYWMLLKQYSTDSLCESGDANTDACATACAKAVANNTDGFRTAMFESMW